MQNADFGVATARNFCLTAQQGRMLNNFDPMQLGQRRDALHEGQHSTRNLSRYSSHAVGLAGEKIFAQRFRLQVDDRPRIDGDGGIDFTLRRWTVDVKTVVDDAMHRPPLLKREVGKLHAMVLVLAVVNMEKRTGRLLGWEYDGVMVRKRTQSFGRGIVSHVAAPNELKSMSIFEWLCDYDGAEK